MPQPPARKSVEIDDLLPSHTRHDAPGGGLRAFTGGGCGVDQRVQTSLGMVYRASWRIDVFVRIVAAMWQNIGRTMAV
ncbi:MAG: hypothetical protein ACK5TP_09225 [bacterium]